MDVLRDLATAHGPARAAAVVAIGEVLGLAARSPTCLVDRFADAVAVLKGVVRQVWPLAPGPSACLSLAAMPVCVETDALVRDVLGFLCFVSVWEKGAGVVATGKVFSAYATLVGKVGPSADGRVVALSKTVAKAAVSFLRLLDDGARDVKRPDVDAARVAALNVVSGTLLLLEEKGKRDEDSAECARVCVAALLRVVRGEYAINAKCICCRAVGVVLSGDGAHGIVFPLGVVAVSLWTMVQDALREGSPRLQLSAAKAAREVDVSRAELRFVMSCLEGYLSVFSATMGKLETDAFAGKERTLLLALKEVLGDTVYDLLCNADSAIWTEMVMKWMGGQDGNSFGESLRDCVLAHLGLPMRIVVDGEEGLDERCRERMENDTVLIASLPKPSQAVVERMRGLLRSAGDPGQVKSASVDVEDDRNA